MMSRQRPYGKGVVRLPGRPTLWKTTGIPPEPVRLPLFIGPNPVNSILLIVGACLLGLFATMLCFAALASFSWRSILRVPAFGIFILMCAGNVYFAARDMKSRDPILIIDAQGFWDLRLRHSILWSEIERAETYSGYRTGLGGVALYTKRPTSPRYNCLRFGATSALQYRRSGAVVVPLRLLDRDRYWLARLFVTLVNENGGKARRV